MKETRLVFEKIDPREHGQMLFEMDVKAFCRDFDYPADSVETTLDYLKNSLVYIAKKNDQIIGLFAYQDVENKVEVMQLIVLPDFQNMGYGKELVDEMLKELKDKEVWLVTHPKNIGAIIVYLKNGFEITDFKDNYYGDGQPRIKLVHARNII